MLIKNLLRNVRLGRTRCTSTSTQYLAYPEVKKMSTELEQQEYDFTLLSIREDIKKSFEELPLCTKHLTDVTTYALADQVHYTGCSVPVFYKMFKQGRNFTPKDVKVANILGRCVDLLFGACQITDDLMDASSIKLGRPCLYQKKGFGMKAINDALLVHQCIYLLLKKYLRDHPSYLSILDLTRLMNTYLSCGQTMDLAPTGGEFNVELYTKERFKNIMTCKSSYTVFLYPIIVALHLSNKYSERLHRQAEKFCHLIGVYYGAQNDMLDCYADPSQTGSLGTDIELGKSTWLIIKALEIATDEQKQTLAKHYGRNNQVSAWEVRNIYNQMDIFNLFLEYEQECFLAIFKLIDEVDDILKDPFKKMSSIFEVVNN